MKELEWEAVDVDAPYPHMMFRAAGSKREYRIAHYIPHRDKKFDRGPAENWTLSTEPISTVSYRGTLESAKAEAARIEAMTTTIPTGKRS